MYNPARKYLQKQNYQVDLRNGYTELISSFWDNGLGNLLNIALTIPKNVDNRAFYPEYS
jgi:hypothetical protein